MRTASWLGRLGNRRYWNPSRSLCRVGRLDHWRRMRKRRLRHVRMRSVDHMFKVSHHRVSHRSRDRVSYRSLGHMMRRVRHMRMRVPHVRRLLVVGMRHNWIRLRVVRYWIMVMRRRMRVIYHLIKVMSRRRRHVRVQMRVVHHGIIMNHLRVLGTLRLLNMNTLSLLHTLTLRLLHTLTLRLLHALNLWWISQVMMNSLRWRFGRERSLNPLRCFNDLSRLGDFE